MELSEHGMLPKDIQLLGIMDMLGSNTLGRYADLASLNTYDILGSWGSYYMYICVHIRNSPTPQWLHYPDPREQLPRRELG